MTTPVKQFYKPREIADMFAVRIETVRIWIREGDLKAIKLPGGHWRVSHEEVTRFANSKYGRTEQ